MQYWEKKFWGGKSRVLTALRQGWIQPNVTWRTDPGAGCRKSQRFKHLLPSAPGQVLLPQQGLAPGQLPTITSCSGLWSQGAARLYLPAARAGRTQTATRACSPGQQMHVLTHQELWERGSLQDLHIMLIFRSQKRHRHSSKTSNRTLPKQKLLQYWTTRLIRCVSINFHCKFWKIIFNKA